MIQHLRPTWLDIEVGCYDIYRSISTYYNDPSYIKAIVCITRGGVIPGGILASLFGVQDMGFIHAITYDTSRKPLPKDKIHLEMNGKALDMMRKTNTLLVDDIMDSGRTISLVNVFGVLCVKSALYIKPQHTHLKGPGFFYHKIAQPEEWVVFPWEKEALLP